MLSKGDLLIFVCKDSKDFHPGMKTFSFQVKVTKKCIKIIDLTQGI